MKDDANEDIEQLKEEPERQEQAYEQSWEESNRQDGRYYVERKRLDKWSNERESAELERLREENIVSQVQQII